MTDPMELVERPDPTSAMSRDPLPPSILADALLQVQSETIVEVGERRIHAENLVAMAAACIRELVEALRPLAIHADHYQQRPDNWVIGGTVANGLPTNRIDVGHCRRAKALISPPATDRGGV